MQLVGSSRSDCFTQGRRQRHCAIDTTINYYRQYTNMYDKNENINTSTIQIQIVLLRAADSGKHITVAHCI